MDDYKRKWLINQLRRLSLKWPPRLKALNRTKETYYINSKKGKPMKRIKFTCEMCGAENLKDAEKQMDHINPVINPKLGWVSLDAFVDSLFCYEDNFQTLCLICHEEKTAKENAKRDEF